MNALLPNVRYQGRPSPAEMQRRWRLAADAMRAEGIDCIIMQANDPILGGYVKWFCETQTIHICTVLFDSDCGLSFIGHGPAGFPALGPMYGIPFKYNVAIPTFHNALYADCFDSAEAIKIIRKEGYKTIGFIAENLISMAFYKNLTQSLPELEYSNFTAQIDRLIALKSDEQLEALDRAVQLHETVAAGFGACLRPQRMERDAGADLYKMFAALACDEYLNNTFIGSDPKAPAPVPLHFQNKLMDSGDLVYLLLETPSLENYYAEFTRYWSLGPPSARAEELMAQTVECQDYIASIAKPGVQGKELFEALNDWLQTRGFPVEKRLFGHSQGYNLVERPYFDAFETMQLEEGMFIAIHPEIRSDGYFVCACDNFVVQKNGARLINRFPRKIIEV